MSKRGLDLQWPIAAIQAIGANIITRAIAILLRD